MYSLDQSHNCRIFDNSFFQDLQQYTIYAPSSGNPVIDYDDGLPPRAINIRMDKLIEYIDSTVEENVWTPAIISTDNNIQYKPIYGKQQIRNTILGIENFISFEPLFENWRTVSAADGTTSAAGSMISNWFISSMFNTIEPEYGVLFWYKKNGPSSDQAPQDPGNPGPAPTPTPSPQPVTVMRYTIKPGIPLTSSIPNPDAPDDPEQNIQSTAYYDLWISDGECFSYFDGPVDRLRSRAKQENSKTYLSPGLMSIYREIYHRLTLRKTRLQGSGLNKQQGLALQKICYFLSSSPLHDRTTIDILNDTEIYDLVLAYVNTASIDFASTEIDKIKNICKTVFRKYKNLSINISKDHLRNNYIQDKPALCKKIMSKYVPVLSVTSDIGLRYKKQLSNGPHAIINLSSISLYDKTIPATGGQIYNNSSIKIGNINYETNISTSGSEILIYADNFTNKPKIYLADNSLPPNINSVFYVGSGLRITDYVAGREYKISGRDILPSDPIEYSYNWEKISGPNCIKFTDYNKDRFRQQRFYTSTDSSPDIYIRQSGTYEIKGTRTKAGGVVQSDVFKITTSDTEPLTSITPPSPAANNQVSLGIFKQLAFNKYGLLWIVDSDNYYDSGDSNFQDDYNIGGVVKLTDTKLDFSVNGDTINLQDSPADLIFKFYPNNTKILLLSVQIEHMRDYKNIFGNCKSFYEEKIIRTSKPISMQDQLGSSDFARAYGGSTTFYAYTSGVKTNNSAVFGTPAISTVLAPKIFGYGGYDDNIINSIGINMPSHFKGGLEGLPLLTKRNDLTSNSGIYCHLKEVLPSGTGHYVNFTQGHFHPLNGWVTGMPGKSVVVENSLDNQNSMSFKGPGILNISPSLDGKTSLFQSAIGIYIKNTANPSDNKYQTVDQRGFDSVNVSIDPGSNTDLKIYDVSDGWDNSDSCPLSKQDYGISVGAASKLIKDIEVKLNFLNYPNPKNLLIWLDVNNPSLTGLPTSNKYFVSNNITSSELDSYRTATTLYNGFSKLYLLNQENISNYGVNFSVTFSDHASKYCNATVYNNSISAVSPKQELLKNDGTIRPTLHTFGYNDITSETYKSCIVNNSLNDIQNTFSKYNGIPLTGTIFTLNIAVMDAIDYSVPVLDNLLINDNMAGLTSTEHRKASNTVSNSLCSWEVIVHTQDVKYPIAEDFMGYIDYYTSTSGTSYVPYTGYKEFLGNFTGKEFLIPNVNVNAPYDYIANISDCFYADPNVTRSPSSQPPTFPSLLPYMMVGLGFTFGTAVGGLVAVSLANAFYANGGRADPIVNYFIDQRNYTQTQNVNAQYYKPVYSREPYGDAHKAIICASDNGAVWYYFEVPIFRYSNTPMMIKNKYGYIKLYKDSFPALSNFQYNIVKTWSDLKLSPIVYSFTDNIALSGETTTYPKDNMVYVGAQSTETENGYYIVESGTWTRVPTSGDYRFMKLNLNASAINNDDLTKNNKCVMVPGTRAYYSFDTGESVYVSSLDANLTISQKMLLSTYEGQKTLFVFPSAIDTNGYISKPDAASSNIIALYDKNYTTRDPEYLPLNQWAFSKSTSSMIPKIDPEMRLSAYAEGSVGWGTDLLRPKSLFSMGSLYNKIVDVNKDIANSHLNDKYKYNTLTIVDTGNNTSFITFSSGDANTDLLLARSYTKSDLGYVFEYNNVKYNDDLSIDTITKRLRTTTSNDDGDGRYVEFKSNKFKSGLSTASGNISIQNDYSFYTPVSVSSGDLATIQNRLSYLINTALPSGMDEYNGLPEDPTGCYRSVPSLTAVELQIPITSGNCPKARVKQKVHNWLYEKNQLQDLLQIASTGIETPYITATITANTGDNSLKITKTENSSLYWIQIDPEQYCNVSYENTVKIFEKLEWSIVGIVGNYVEDSIITPIMAQNLPTGITADENMKKTGNTIEYKATSAKILDKIAEFTTQYPTIAWTHAPNPTNGDVYDRMDYGSLQTDSVDTKKLLIGINDISKDMLITYRETYIVPTGVNNNRHKKIKDVLNLNGDLKIKFRNIPRKIKGTDCWRFTKYSYNKRGHLVKMVNPASSVEKISNNFVCWHCIDTSGNYTGVPNHLMVQNEMLYRGFFGSTDGIEHKNTYLSDSKEAWEWIPYEYYDRYPTPSATPSPSPGASPPPPPPTPLPKPCGSSNSAAGGQGGQSVTYTMPEAGGMVTFSYQAYNIPDSFKVEGGGSTFVDTGQVSGGADIVFCKPSGVTSLTVTVGAPLFGTAWTYTLSCPGDAC